jgi:hypothetical protein
MAGHEEPASLRPRCTRSGSSVAAIPVYQFNPLKYGGYECLSELNSKTPYSANNLNVVPWIFAINSNSSLYKFNPMTFQRETHLSL